MAATKRINLDEAWFTTDEAPSSLELYLHRTRDPETGALVPKKGRKSKTVAASTFEHTKVATQEMIDSRDWTGCRPRHLVALFDLMYAKVYGIEITMSGTERYTMTLRAGGFVKRAFGGDYDKVLDYFRWAWTREREREKWRRDNGQEGGSISLGGMFSNKMLDEYRLSLARQRR